MYSKEEISKTRQQFWTTWGQYMKPVPSASGEKVNWANYKTGIPNIFFRMRAENGYASAAIELTGPDTGRQEKYKQLSQLHHLLPGEWIWEEQATDENGRAISRIYAILNDVHLMKKEDWPAMISFLKERITMLDAFWNDARFALE